MSHPEQEQLVIPLQTGITLQRIILDEYTTREMVEDVIVRMVKEGIISGHERLLMTATVPDFIWRLDPPEMLEIFNQNPDISILRHLFTPELREGDLWPEETKERLRREFLDNSAETLAASVADYFVCSEEDINLSDDVIVRGRTSTPLVAVRQRTATRKGFPLILRAIHAQQRTDGMTPIAEAVTHVKDGQGRTAFELPSI